MQRVFAPNAACRGKRDLRVRKMKERLLLGVTRYMFCKSLSYFRRSKSSFG